MRQQLIYKLATYLTLIYEIKCHNSRIQWEINAYPSINMSRMLFYARIKFSPPSSIFTYYRHIPQGVKVITITRFCKTVISVNFRSSPAWVHACMLFGTYNSNIYFESRADQWLSYQVHKIRFTSVKKIQMNKKVWFH